MALKNNHITSLRIPADWHEWVKGFGNRYNLSTAQTYREIVRQFISAKTNQSI